MMEKEILQKIEPFIHRIMNDPDSAGAIEILLNEEVRQVEGQFYVAAKAQNATQSNMLVGQIDGINNLWHALQRVAEGYRKRKTSES